jgi:hypothetical protein
VKRRYATASIVSAERVVFNIKGNDDWHIRRDTHPSDTRKMKRREHRSATDRNRHLGSGHYVALGHRLAEKLLR